MKRTALILAFIVPVFLFAQETPLNKIFSKYVEDPGFSTTEIKTSEVSFEWEQDENTEHIRKVLSDIESIRIINLDEESPEGKVSAEKFHQKIMKAIEKADYVDVITVRDDGESVNLYFLEKGDKLREVALVVREKENVSLITITGDIDPEMIIHKETLKGLGSLRNFYVENEDTKIEINN